MVEIWRRSETFQHCFVVIPIVLWLVWGERDASCRGADAAVLAGACR